MELKDNIKNSIKEITSDCYENNRLSIQKICNKLNLSFFEADFDDERISGQIEKSKGSDEYVIYVNRKHPTPRKRFTVSHEIGHYISFLNNSFSKEQMERDGYEDYAILYCKDGNYSEAETEANQIAFELLMPSDKIKELMDKNLTPEEMSEVFYVSPSVLTLRLKELYPDLMLT